MKIFDGGTTFPQPLFDSSGERVGYSRGMSLRDWFAGKAMQGMLADPTVRPECMDKFASNCYAWADAMIAEREKRIAPAPTT